MGRQARGRAPRHLRRKGARRRKINVAENIRGAVARRRTATLKVGGRLLGCPPTHLLEVDLHVVRDGVELQIE